MSDDDKRVLRVVLAVVFAWAIVCLAVLVSGVVVAFHFLAKWW